MTWLRLLSPFLLAAVCAASESADDDEPPRRLETIEEVDVAVKRVSVSPAVFLVSNFLEDDTCDSIAKIARERLAPDESEVGDGRSSALFSRDDHDDIPILSTVARRQRNLVRELISDQNGEDGKDFLKLYPVNTDFAETLEVVEFGQGGYRRLHNEAFHRDRVLATLVFLEDTPAGGETVFPMLEFDQSMQQYVPSTFFQKGETCAGERDSACAAGGANHTELGMEFCCCTELLRIAPKKGDALVYLTVDRDGQPAHPAVHASCPVLSSEEKLVLRQWVHAEPLGDASPRALNTDAGEPLVEHDGLGVPYSKPDMTGAPYAAREDNSGGGTTHQVKANAHPKGLNPGGAAARARKAQQKKQQEESEESESQEESSGQERSKQKKRKKKGRGTKYQTKEEKADL